MFAQTCVMLLALHAAGPRGELLLLPGDSAARMAIGLDVFAEGGPETVVRDYLSREASTFGLQKDDQLALIRSNAEHLVFERRRAGVAILDANITATFDSRGHLTMLHVGPGVPPASGLFYVDLPNAERIALHGIAHGSVLESKAAWHNEGDALRPVFLVRVVQPTPYDVLRVLIDAQTGRVLTRQTEKLKAMGSVYDISPTKTPTVVNRALSNLSSTTQLKGSNLIARNCTGNGASTSCAPTASPNGSGDYIFTPDYGANNTDKFSEVMSYYQIDRFATWVSTLKPGFSLGYIDALTNVDTDSEFFLAGGPFSHYAIELGQGPQSMTDWSYDADIVWHELGHGVVQDTSQFGFYGQDQYGIAAEGGSLNEGTADCFSIGFADDPVLGDFIGPALQSASLIPTPYIRKLDDMYTCQGSSSIDGGNPGRFGEIHDDGRIVGSFFWALHDRTRALPQYAAEKALLDALGGVGSSASYHELALALQQSMTTKYDAGELVQCLSCEHDMSGCDSRTRKIYPNEQPQARLLGSDLSGAEGNGEMPQTFQYELAVPANQAVSIDVAITEGAQPKLYARFNQKVTWSGGSPTYDQVITTTSGVLPAQGTAGTWYLQGAAVDPGSCGFSECTRRFGVHPHAVPGAPTRPAVTAQNCQLGSGPGTCSCTPSCAGKMCGSDGCGGSCGACGTGMGCNSGGQCACIPQCTGKACGDDGCGGSCGMCSSGTCNASTGVCEGCVPQCSGKMCGPNGCGQACGQCTMENFVCDVGSGQCVDIGTGGGGGGSSGSGGGAAGGGSGDTGGGGGVTGSCGCASGPGALGALALLLLRRRPIASLRHERNRGRPAR